MKTKRLVAKKIETAFGEDPNWMAMIASSEDDAVEVVFETMQAPATAAGILVSSQDAVRRMRPESIVDALARNLDISRQSMPEAIDISLADEGNVLCINVGSGAFFFRLTEPAKRAINNPLKNIGTL